MAQPLTAPEIRPRVSQRWMTAKMTRLGRVASSALAASGPSLTMPSIPTNCASRSGSVALSGSLRRTSAKKNSFQAVTNAKSAVTTIPGASSGRDDGAEDGQPAGAVDQRRLLEVARDPAHVALEHPEDERERPHDVDEDEPDVRVHEVEVAEEQEQRDDDQDQREHLAEQDPAEPDLGDQAPLPREHIRRGEPDHDVRIAVTRRRP